MGHLFNVSHRIGRKAATNINKKLIFWGETPAKDSMAPQILRSKEAAERIAADCTAGDPDWTYKVMQFGKYFAVEVSDPDGLIGYL